MDEIIKALEKLNGKEYKCGDVSFFIINPNEFEIWIKDSFVTIKKEQADDFNNCLQMMSMDVLKILGQNLPGV